MSDGEWKPNIIVRVGKGSDKPLDPYQHGRCSEPFRQIMTNATIVKLDSVDKIKPIY